MKLIRKIFYIIIVLFVSGIAISGLTVIIYKDRIIDLLKSEIDKRIKTKLEVKYIDLKLLKGFPNISIQFSGVKFHSAFENELLLESDHIYFVLNVIHLFNNKITVERLEIENAKFIYHKNLSSDSNFDVFINSVVTSNERGTLDIKSTKFSNVEIVHIDDVQKIYDVYNISSLKGSVNLNDSIYQIDVESNAIISKTERAYFQWVLNKKIYLKTRITYDGKEISFNSSELEINTSQFKFSGVVGLDSKKKISINLNGRNLNYSKIIMLLPNNYQKKLKSYNGKGTIEFNAFLKGNYVDHSLLRFDARFKIEDFEIDHLKLKYPVKEIYLDGNVQIKDIRKLETGRLEIKEISAFINKRKIEIKGSIVNFKSPEINGVIKGEIDVAWASFFIDTDTQVLYDTATGILDVDLTASININKTGEDVKFDKLVLNGKIEFKDVGINNFLKLTLKNLDGEVLIANNKIELSNWTGVYGRSDFKINGFVLATHLWTNNANDKFEAKIDLSSDRIELDEIVATLINLKRDSMVTPNQESFRFNIDLHLNVNKLNFRKFRGENFSAEVLIDKNGLIIRRVSSKGLGGTFILTGKITNQFNNDYYIEAKVRTKSVDLDSLFYVFNNFKQDFITDKVIKGEVNSEVYTYMYFDKDWNLKRELLYVEGLLQVKNGELNNFEPIMALSSYLKNEDENLSRLRFSDLESRIIISNDTVYISDVYIGSNVRNIKIGGYHTLDQHIDYGLSVSIINGKKDKDEAFGKVKRDKEGKLYMPFRIKGTTADYKVNYDLKTASSNFIKGIKKELSEIGNAFKGKQVIKEKGDTLLLEDDEFFDWDNN